MGAQTVHTMTNADKRLIVKIDEKWYDIKETFYQGHDKLPPMPTASGAQLLSMAGRDPISYQLFRVSGLQPDEFLSSTQAVELHDGDQFYALPPTDGG